MSGTVWYPDEVSVVARASDHTPHHEAGEMKGIGRRLSAHWYRLGQSPTAPRREPRTSSQGTASAPGAPLIPSFRKRDRDVG